MRSATSAAATTLTDRIGCRSIVAIRTGAARAAQRGHTAYRNLKANQPFLQFKPLGGTTRQQASRDQANCGAQGLEQEIA